MVTSKKYLGKPWGRASINIIIDSYYLVKVTMVEDNRTEAQESMLTAYPQLRGMYAVNDGNSVVYYL